MRSGQSVPRNLRRFCFASGSADKIARWIGTENEVDLCGLRELDRRKTEKKGARSYTIAKIPAVHATEQQSRCLESGRRPESPLDIAR